MSEIYNKIIREIERVCREDGRYKNPTRLAEACDLAPVQVFRVLNDEPVKAVKNLMRILDALGASISFPDDKDSVFCPIQTAVSNSSLNGQALFGVPKMSIYDAAFSLAEDKGIKDSELIRGWVVVSKEIEQLRIKDGYLQNLLAVELGRQDDIMSPTLNPRDIVILDIQDRLDHFSPPGNVYLVRDPQNTSYVSRVHLNPRKENEMEIVFYGDNMEKYPPRVFSLNDYENGELSKAILGRVVWAWTNISQK